MQSCVDSCPKVQQKAKESSQGPRPQTINGSSYAEQTEDADRSFTRAKRSATSNRRSPSQSQKSVQIGGVTAVEATDSRITRGSERSTNFAGSLSREKASADDQYAFQTRSTTGTGASASRESSQRSDHSTRDASMSGRVRSSAKAAEWNPKGHNPCPSSCPMSKARDIAAKKARLRQDRLDEYLLNKGFRYFDDLCTCSSICLFNQLRRDKFVRDFLKSACFFTLGMKLCEELDAWNIIG